MDEPKQLSQKERVSKVASTLSAILLKDDGSVSKVRNNLQSKLSDLKMTMAEYLELCANTDVINETIRQSIAKHVVPFFPETSRAVAEKAATGDSKAVDQQFEMLTKISTLMEKIQKREVKHSLQIYDKMTPDQLVEENLHQIKQQMKMQIQLPNGYEQLREITAQVFREYSNTKRGLTPKGNPSTGKPTGRPKVIEAKIT